MAAILLTPQCGNVWRCDVVFAAKSDVLFPSVGGLGSVSQRILDTSAEHVPGTHANEGTCYVSNQLTKFNELNKTPGLKTTKFSVVCCC